MGSIPNDHSTSFAVAIGVLVSIGVFTLFVAFPGGVAQDGTTQIDENFDTITNRNLNIVGNQLVINIGDGEYHECMQKAMEMYDGRPGSTFSVDQKRAVLDANMIKCEILHSTSLNTYTPSLIDYENCVNTAVYDFTDNPFYSEFSVNYARGTLDWNLNYCRVLLAP